MWIKEGNAEYSGHLFAEYLYGRDNFINKVKLNHKDVLIRAHFDRWNLSGFVGHAFRIHLWNTYLLQGRCDAAQYASISG